MNCTSLVLCLFLSLLSLVRSQALQSDDFITVMRDEDGYRPVEIFRQFKKSFVRPCVYNMGNCITSTQQERLLKHLRSLVALRDQH